MADKTAPLEAGSPVIVRYAETDDDVIAIHQFLLVIAQPAMRCPVNAEKSLMEIIRVAKEEVAMMAIRDGHLIGTLGVMQATWWYGDGEFLTDRWHFVLPGERHGEADRMLMAEAAAISDAAGLEFIDQGKIRQRGNKNLFLMMPRVYSPPSATASESRRA